MRLARWFAVLMLPFAALLSGCSQLGLFNALTPGDGGAVVAARGLAYGTDPRQKLDIYTPADRTSAARPVVVFFYGGSWQSGYKGGYGFVGNAFAARGFVTVIFDYRLVPSVRYPAFIDDGAAAVAWVNQNIARYGGAPDRIYAVGHSAGAYNMMMVALAPEFLRRQGLQPSVLKGVAGLSGPYDFLPLDDQSTIAAFGNVAPDDLPATQPINRAESARATPPVFLATGDADRTVRPRNTERLAAALRNAGKPVETKVYPGISHVGTLLAISRPFRGRASVLDDMTQFLQEIDAARR